MMALNLLEADTVIQDIKLRMNAKHQQSLMKQLQEEQLQLMDFQ